jgi:hypothetical protein
MFALVSGRNWDSLPIIKSRSLADSSHRPRCTMGNTDTDHHKRHNILLARICLPSDNPSFKLPADAQWQVLLRCQPNLDVGQRARHFAQASKSASLFTHIEALIMDVGEASKVEDGRPTPNRQWDVMNERCASRVMPLGAWRVCLCRAGVRRSTCHGARFGGLCRDSWRGCSN